MQEPELAQRMYEAFCASLPKSYMPTISPAPWETLPDVLKAAWRAAAGVR